MPVETKVLTDAKGRKITVQSLTVVEQTRIMRILGADQVQNTALNWAYRIAMMTRQIGEWPRPPTMTTVEDAEDVLQRLDDEGFRAVESYLEADIAATMERLKAAQKATESDGPLVPSAPSFGTAPSST